MKIRFKFHRHVDAESREEICAALPGHAERVFPSDDDPELEGLYVTTVADARSADTLAQLNASDAVEFAEPEPERRLRPPG